MAFWRLWTQDMASGRYSELSASSEYGTAIYTVDGDPSTVWYLNATTGLWELRVGVSRVVRGLGVANHNWAGRTVTFTDSPDGSTWYDRIVVTPPTNDDFLVPFSSPFPGAYHRVAVGVGSDDGYAGIVSLLTDYDETGSGEGNGFGILALGDQGMVRDRIGRSLVPDVGVLDTVGGLEILQGVSEPYDAIRLDVAAMRSATGLEWYRVRQSYKGRNATCPNPGWAKGVWVTNDEAVDDTACPAMFCHPTAGLDEEMTRGRSDSTITLRARSRGV